jgi:hypothetical protein
MCRKKEGNERECGIRVSYSFVLRMRLIDPLYDLEGSLSRVSRAATGVFGRCEKRGVEKRNERKGGFLRNARRRLASCSDGALPCCRADHAHHRSGRGTFPIPPQAGGLLGGDSVLIHQPICFRRAIHDAGQRPALPGNRVG